MQYDNLNKYVLRLFLKAVTVSDDWMSTGRLFDKQASRQPSDASTHCCDGQITRERQRERERERERECVCVCGAYRCMTKTTAAAAADQRDEWTCHRDTAEHTLPSARHSAPINTHTHIHTHTHTRAQYTGWHNNNWHHWRLVSRAPGLPRHVEFHAVPWTLRFAAKFIACHGNTRKRSF